MENRQNYLTQLAALAMEGINSSDLLKRAGAFLIYSNLADFLILQGARLCEDIQLRSIRAWGIDTPDLSTEHYYYSLRKTRKALKMAKLMLDSKNTLNLIFKARLENFVKSAEQFLDKRNSLIHNLCHPEKSEIVGLTASLSDTEQAYKLLIEHQREFIVYVINGGKVGESTLPQNEIS